MRKISKKISRSKLSTIVVIGLALAMFVPLTGCITEPPEPAWYLFDLDLTAEQISTVLGMNQSEVEMMMSDLNVETYYCLSSYNASVVYNDIKEEYTDWTKYLDGPQYISDSLTIYAGAWRRIITIHSVIVAEGSYIYNETGYDTIVLTSYGEAGTYSEIFGIDYM